MSSAAISMSSVDDSPLDMEWPLAHDYANKRGRVAILRSMATSGRTILDPGAKPPYAAHAPAGLGTAVCRPVNFGASGRFRSKWLSWSLRWLHT